MAPSHSSSNLASSNTNFQVSPTELPLYISDDWDDFRIKLNTGVDGFCEFLKEKTLISVNSTVWHPVPSSHQWPRDCKTGHLESMASSHTVQGGKDFFFSCGARWIINYPISEMCDFHLGSCYYVLISSYYGYLYMHILYIYYLVQCKVFYFYQGSISTSFWIRHRKGFRGMFTYKFQMVSIHLWK